MANKIRVHLGKVEKVKIFETEKICEYDSLSDACEAHGLNYNSVRVQLSRSKDGEHWPEKGAQKDKLRLVAK